ncbi:MAG TPA: hypothetical protein VKH61_15795, partial [Streptosporangiaceae bacterium]|nr:hypothetical protein [Streptosporangiaceae bacterium]
IHEHFVVINGRRWPPKQVLALVTGLDRADFTTHQARRALTRLGFPAARAASSREHHLRAAQAGQGAARLVRREIGPIEPRYQGQDLLGRPAPPVDHHEVLMDRIRQDTLQCCLHDVAVQLIPVA